MVATANGEAARRRHCCLEAVDDGKANHWVELEILQIILDILLLGRQFRFENGITFEKAIFGIEYYVSPSLIHDAKIETDAERAVQKGSAVADAEIGRKHVEADVAFKGSDVIGIEDGVADLDIFVWPSSQIGLIEIEPQTAAKTKASSKRMIVDERPERRQRRFGVIIDIVDFAVGVKAQPISTEAKTEGLIKTDTCLKAETERADRGADIQTVGQGRSFARLYSISITDGLGQKNMWPQDKNQRGGEKKTHLLAPEQSTRRFDQIKVNKALMCQLNEQEPCRIFIRRDKCARMLSC
ncbi:MAG: hypothetical protein AAGA21_10200 [Pseudomonadota bacterium]